MDNPSPSKIQPLKSALVVLTSGLLIGTLGLIFVVYDIMRKSTAGVLMLTSRELTSLGIAGLFTFVFFVSFVWILLLQRTEPVSEQDCGGAGQGEKTFASYIIGAFIFILCLIYLGAIVLGTGTASVTLLEIFKTGFTILGATLTTIIGFYFGNKGDQQNQKIAEIQSAVDVLKNTK